VTCNGREKAYRACLAAASAALQNHDVADADRHLQSAPESLRSWEWRHLRSRLDDSSVVVPLPAEKSGFLLAAPARFQLGVLSSSGLRLTDLEGDEPRTVPLGLEHRHHLNFTQTHRGLRITAWVEDNTAFDVLDDAGQVLCRVATPENRDGDPAHVVVSPDGTRLACRSDGDYRRVAVFDATSGKQTATCTGHRDNINALAFSPDSAWLVTGSVDRTVRLWDAATGQHLVTCQGHTSTVESATFSADGARLLTASVDRTVRQWDTQTGQPIELPFDRHTAQLYSAVYSLDGQWIASTGEDRTIRVWRARGRQEVAVLHGHTGSVIQVAFTPDGRRLASRSCHEGSVYAWDDTMRVCSFRLVVWNANASYASVPYAGIAPGSQSEMASDVPIELRMPRSAWPRIPADASCLPSGAKARPVSHSCSPVRARQLRRSLPLAGSHSRMVRSSPPEASVAPSGEKASAATAP
jgi:hypothetical protein